MNKFEINAIRKQDEAYKEYYAEKAFKYSCEMCASRNLRAGKTCSNCPVLEAHKRALKEIISGKREAPKHNYGASKFYNNKINGGVHITIVVNYNHNKEEK